MTYLGDGERGLALAEESLAIARERVPPAVSIARVSEALALISLGRGDEARAPLDEVDLMMLPEPDRTFLRVASSAARARLALLDGDVEEAEAVARSVIEELRTNEVEILVAGALVVLARALLAADRLDDAGHELAHGTRVRTAGGARGSGRPLGVSRSAPGAEPAEAADLRSRAARCREIAGGLRSRISGDDSRRDDVRAWKDHAWTSRGRQPRAARTGTHPRLWRR